MNTYLIQLRGQVELEDLNQLSPHQMAPLRSEPGSTLITICTDQSGMIGLLRHLHNLGLTLLSIRQAEEVSNLENDHER